MISVHFGNAEDNILSSLLKCSRWGLCSFSPEFNSLATITSPGRQSGLPCFPETSVLIAFLYIRFFSPAIRENLLTPGPTIDGRVGDLSAINIQRGRDHGLPPYNQFREAGGLGLAASIDNFTNIDQAQRERLRVAYNNNVNDIDLYVGGMSETPLPGSILGNTFSFILAKSLMNLRLGDRFWYERNDSYIGFTMRQLNAIRNASLARVLCDNTEEVSRIYPNVFHVKSTVNCLTDCTNLKVLE